MPLEKSFGCLEQRYEERSMVFCSWLESCIHFGGLICHSLGNPFIDIVRAPMMLIRNYLEFIGIPKRSYDFVCVLVKSYEFIRTFKFPKEFIRNRLFPRFCKIFDGRMAAGAFVDASWDALGSSWGFLGAFWVPLEIFLNDFQASQNNCTTQEAQCFSFHWNPASMLIVRSAVL